MVSSISSIFRPQRRERATNNKKKEKEEPVTITKEAIEAVVEMAVNDAVQEVVIESPDLPKPEEPKENGNTMTVVETTEEVEQCGCPMNLKAIKAVVDEVPQEYKEAAKITSIITSALVGLFCSIVVYRCLRHFYMPQPEGFFCSHFSTLFSPLFDALCETKTDFLTELSHESHVLADQVGQGVNGFFSSIADGFHAFATISHALLEAIWGHLVFAFGELFENVSENISFMYRFILQFFDFIGDSICVCINSIETFVSNFYNNLSRVVAREPEPSFW